MFFEDANTSADNSSAVTLKCNKEQTNHQIFVSTTGTVSAGTASVSVDGQTVSGTIDLTSPTPKVFEGSCTTVVVTPASFSAGCTFTATLRSW